MIEHPAAFQFIINEDIYLLPQDKINPGKKSVRKEETPQVTFNYKGNNKKQLLILTHYTDEEFIAGEHFTALQSILNRKGYDTDDIAILNIARHTTDISAIKAHFLPLKMLILGQNALPAGMPSVSFNQLQQIESINVLHSFSFKDMMTNTDNKRTFWEQMKNL